jgi:outer membrane lipoprotein-sorting protein
MNLFNRRYFLNLWKPSIIILMSIFGFLTFSQGAEYTAGEILERLDNTMTAETLTAEYRMIIHGKRNTRTLVSMVYQAGSDSSYVEYTSPPREKGTKMLKVGDKLWIYSPLTDRVLQIAGHLMRQSVMGSDYSYEDMTEQTKLTDIYAVEIIGHEILNGSSCVILELNGKEPGLAYAKRKIWVDIDHWLAIKEERFAKSNKLLKISEILEIQQVGRQWYPKHITLKDANMAGEGTEIWLDKVVLNAPIPRHLFTKAALRR